MCILLHGYFTPLYRLHIPPTENNQHTATPCRIFPNPKNRGDKALSISPPKSLQQTKKRFKHPKSLQQTKTRIFKENKKAIRIFANRFNFLYSPFSPTLSLPLTTLNNNSTLTSAPHLHNQPMLTRSLAVIHYQKISLGRNRINKLI